MFRKSVLVVLFSFALLPNVAGALGLGGIRAQSALNEPFLGQVDLLDVQRDELDTVKVSLASEDEFAKVGAERAFFLTKLKFRPQVSSKGRAVIRVTSTEPIREPFLDFLIQVDWPKGRLIKEYTVLLDPPVTSDRPPPRQARLARPPASVDTSVFPIRYGPVQRGMNLWRIARRLASTGGATIAQTAMALYRTNQEAFIRGDINKLKVDQILEIPTAAELFALDKRAADRELGAAVRGQRVTATPLTDITAPQYEDRLEIASVSNRASGGDQPPAEVPRQRAPSSPQPKEVSATEAVAPDRNEGLSSQVPSAELSGQGDEAAAAGEDGPELSAMQEDLLLVQEAGESTRQETEELRNRIRELEGQLADIRRLLELSNERFAVLQQAKTGKSEKSGAEATDVPLSEAAAAQEPEEAANHETEAVAAPDTALARDESKPLREDKIETVSLQSAQNSEDTFWESISQPALVLAGVVALLLLILGWMVSQRRKRFEESLATSEITPGYPPAQSPASDLIAATPLSEQEQPAADPGLRDSSTYSDLGRMEDETEEGSILSEADVYIAYGRYREAEALLEEEIKTSPDRLDLKYKLAETYYGAGNAGRLKALLEKMREAGDDRVDIDQWHRLNTMLEGLEGAGTQRQGPAVARGPDQPPISMSINAAQQEEPISPLGSGLGPSLESRDGERAPGFVPEPDAAQPRANSADMDLGLEDLDIFSGEIETPPVSDESLQVPGAVSELELQLEDLEGIKGEDLAGGTGSLPPPAPSSADALSKIPADSDVDSLEISPLSTDTLDGDVASSQRQKDSGGWDEAATKIDLARAYLEMEDPEEARIILEEVDQEGNESQRVEARKLMERLG
jgi:pilus assembly protein FimV